jgi:hypothetical protein
MVEVRLLSWPLLIYHCRGALLTPEEMEALTEEWRPYVFTHFPHRLRFLCFLLFFATRADDAFPVSFLVRVAYHIDTGVLVSVKDLRRSILRGVVMSVDTDGMKCRCVLHVGSGGCGCEDEEISKDMCVCRNSRCGVLCGCGEGITRLGHHRGGNWGSGVGHA